MLKNIIYCLTLVFIFQSSVFANQTSYPRLTCTSQLVSIVNQIRQLPEAQSLIEAILREGNLHISDLQPHQTHEFRAMWNSDARTIYVNINQERPHIFGSILFEMHNALSTTKFCQLENLAYDGKLNKSAYVEAMEYVEYENSLNTASLAEKGIQVGLYPANARLPTYDSFQEHFYYQRIGGHSAWFAASYDEIVANRMLEDKST